MSDASGATLWGIHAGRAGEAEEQFLKNNCIALGWHLMGDLSRIQSDRDAFKARIADVYPAKTKLGIANNAGQLFRFVHEMKRGDIVVFPSKSDRRVNLGRVMSDYLYEPNGKPFPHIRQVKWLKQVPRTQFSQGALYEIGSAISLFLVKHFAEEFRAALEGKSPVVVPVTQDESVALVSEDVEETTKDFVLKTLSRDAKGLALEGFIVHLLECMGYHARTTRRNEPSVDVIAHKDHLGIEPPIIKVQVKSSDGTATDKDVSALYGKLSAGEYGLFVTLGTFSPPSRSFEQSKSNLRLIDGDELVQLIFEHYEKFDARHKGLLPLRRVYVPAAVERDDEED